MLAMILALVCLAVAVIFFFYLKWEFSSYVKTIDLIPGPQKIPFFGNALSIPLDPCGKQLDLFITIFNYNLIMCCTVLNFITRIENRMGSVSLRENAC